MVRIYNKNNEVKIVTKGAFESIFKPLGYKLVIDVKETKVKENEDKVIPKVNKNKTKNKDTELE